MAYNEDVYVTWVNEIGRLAQRNDSAGTSGRQSRPTSSRQSRPTSSRKRPQSEPEMSADGDAVSSSRSKSPPQTQGDLASNSAGKQQGHSRPTSGGGGWTENQYRLREQDHVPRTGWALGERAAVAEPQCHSALQEPRSHLLKKTRPQPLTSTPYSSPHANSVTGNPPAVGPGFTPSREPSFLYSDDVI